VLLAVAWGRVQVSSKSFRPITCFQISDKGKELVKRIPRKEKEAVHEFVYAKVHPHHHTHTHTHTHRLAGWSC
jgi:hypothetical protein